MLKLIFAAAIAGVAMAVPSASSAQLPQPPTQDSVLLTGAPAFVGPLEVPYYRINALSAASGPSGENPTGHADVVARGIGILLNGPATCLQVSGNTATINFQDQSLVGPFAGAIVTIAVVDDQPDTFGINGIGRTPTDCSQAPFSQLPALSTGDITVVDAQPLQPTSKGQCKDGGWRDFPDFKNQGQCVAFVERGQRPGEANGAG